MRPALLLLVLAPCAVSADSAPQAGPAELAQLTAQITLISADLAALDAQRTAQDRITAAILVTHLHQYIDTYQDLAPPRPPPAAGFQAWYLQLLLDRRGFDPLGPPTPWQQSWMQLRAAEAPQDDTYEALRVSLHHLERLQARLERQLGVAPAASPVTATHGPP